MNTDNTLLNAVIGAVATFGLSFTAVSPVIGGALAAYLEGGETGDGIRIGVLSGAIALLPLALMILVGFVFFVGAGAAVGVLFVLLGAAFIAGYVVGLSALGGVIGIYLRNEL